MNVKTMQRSLWMIFVAGLALAALLGLLVVLTGQVTPAAADEQDTTAGDLEAEVWRTFVTTEGEAAYRAVAGRAAGEMATFRSNRGESDLYAVFPAPGAGRSVQSARWLALDRSGAYSGTATLYLEVRDLDGVLQHTVSAKTLDLQTAPLATWQRIKLAPLPEDRAIEPGEYLAFHLSLDSGSAGDLEAHLLLEVEVE